MPAYDRLAPVELAARTGDVFAEAVTTGNAYEAASLFAAGGVPVLPVVFEAGHKRPAAGAPVWGSSSTRRVDQWWESDDADLFGVAVACGPTTPNRVGLVCIDLDVKHGVDGVARWDADPVVTAARYSVAEAVGQTYVETTMSGGCHLWWVRPAGLHLDNDPALVSPGVELRCWHQYAVIAPTTGYEAVPGTEEAMASIPAWLLGLARVEQWEAKFQSGSATPGGRSSGARRDRAYLSAVVTGEIEVIAAAPKGRRGSTRVRAAFEVGRAAAGCRSTAEEIAIIEQRLIAAAVANAPDEPADATESVRRSLADGLTKRTPKGPTGGRSVDQLDATAAGITRGLLAEHPNGTTRRVGVALLDAAEAVGTAAWLITGDDLAARAGVSRKTALRHRDRLVDSGVFVAERAVPRGPVRYRLGSIDRAGMTQTACRGGDLAGGAKARAQKEPPADREADVLGGWRHDGWAHGALGVGGAKVTAYLAGTGGERLSTRAVAAGAGVHYSTAKRVLPLLFAVGAADHDGTGWRYLGLTAARLESIAARQGTGGRFVTRIGTAEFGRAERRRAQARWAQDRGAMGTGPTV